MALTVGSRLEYVGFCYELLSQLVYEPSIKGVRECLLLWGLVLGN